MTRKYKNTRTLIYVYIYKLYTFVCVCVRVYLYIIYIPYTIIYIYCIYLPNFVALRFVCRFCCCCCCYFFFRFFRAYQIRNIEKLMSASNTTRLTSCLAVAVAVAATSLICSRRHANAVRCQVALCPAPVVKSYITNTQTHTHTHTKCHCVCVCVHCEPFVWRLHSLKWVSYSWLAVWLADCRSFIVVLPLANDNVDSCLPPQFALNFELNQQTRPDQTSPCILAIVVGIYKTLVTSHQVHRGCGQRLNFPFCDTHLLLRQFSDLSSITEEPKSLIVAVAICILIIYWN